jgi:formate hydrogenlyase subunit 3/multisubunit Na+/H+ antiporter MnhD subunit
MGLDIRIPIGLMFAVLGAMLAIFGICSQFGIFSDPAIYERSLGININIWCGLALLAFGAGMYFFGRRGTSTVRPADESPEGRKIEQREHRAGMEREGRRGGH